MERSPFYVPKPELKPVVVERPLPPPPTPSSLSLYTRDGREARDRDSGYPPSTYRTIPSKISRLTGNTGAGSRNNYQQSITSTVRTKYASSIASNRTAGTDGGLKRVERESEKEWENFYIGEDDSEDDAYNKMILGRAMAKIVPEVRSVAPKRDKKKALKWLGLA
jgi:hypothetical protein